ncbi:hypothetical protein [Microbacterium saperdae]|uniref:Uncharacterized protein n=1 Tax=Microbacterium saperdae TaxID=69368 RepID=A0A543BJA6_9MICO|nr:hypothetical protein [Microbacterium saperdae]TQL84896.1 hypothetical protein FB560_0489 [Microbacterium saperdae]GGM58565.1 hypothetical protein GCM10010489_32770 [Microbacterium saperdae]
MSAGSLDNGRKRFAEHDTPDGRKQRREREREDGGSLAAGRALYAEQHSHSGDDKPAGLQAGADRFNAQKGTK